MRFGTLQSIQKQQEPAEQDLDLSQQKEPLDSFDLDDSEELQDPETGLEDEFADKLMSLRAEIDSILDQMGYGENQDDEDFDFEPEEREDDFDFDVSDFDDQEEKEDDFSAFDDEEREDDTEDQDFFDDRQIVGDDAAVDDELPEEDPVDGDENFQGNIRTVAGADLVYKRKDEDGNYEELWIYNVGKDIKKETQIRRAILAGTDIVPNQRESEDGTQRSETYTVGNVQYLKITGLPN